MAFSLIIQHCYFPFSPQYLLEHSCFTVLFQFLSCSKVYQLCMIHICESYMCTYICLFKKISFLFTSPWTTEQSFLCYMVGSHELFILQIVSVVRKIPWSRKWPSAPVFLPGKFHVQRSLVDCRPQGCKELNMTEQLSKHMRINSICMLFQYSSSSHLPFPLSICEFVLYVYVSISAL